MNDLDEAIREHLELKRKHGASEDEVVTKEREAQRQGALPSDPGAQRAGVDELPPAGEEELEPEREAEPERVEPSADVSALDVEPDEVLPEEALDLEIAPAEDPPADADAEGPPPNWAANLPEDREEAGEDPLEETPDFLENTPDQDQLWFEQRPPKDFNFDD
jgi:hypothetical protein